MDLYLTKESKKNLEAIYKYHMQRYIDGAKKGPSKSEIIRNLIDDHYVDMVKEGKIK